jgi:hypothetical protein
MEDDLILERLSTEIGKIGPNIDAVSGARFIYSCCLSTKVDVRTKRKQGIAPQTSVAKQLREIASGAVTLSKRLAVASDGNVFDAWALATCDHSAANTRQDVVVQWNTLKQLLEETRERAHKAGKTAEEMLKVWKIPGQKGRPADDVACLTAAATLEVYERAAGHLGTRSISRDSGRPGGAFHRFLTEVFDILAIKAVPTLLICGCRPNLRS